jgi:hypothetical protein
LDRGAKVKWRELLLLDTATARVCAGGVVLSRNRARRYELFPSNRIYCENCFGGDPADVIKYVLCDTKCGQQGITHRRLRCALAW